MTKLSKEQKAQLEKLGLTGFTTVEESREKLVELMKELGIDDDGESWEDIYSIVETLIEDSAEDEELMDEVEAEDEDEEDEDEEAEDEEAEDEQEIVLPTKKEKQKAEEQKTGKAKAEAKAVEAKKKDKVIPEKVAKAPKVSKRFNPIGDPNDAKKFDGIKKALAKFGKFEYNFIANGGCSIKFLGKNSTKVFLSFDTPRIEDGELIGGMFIPSIKDKEKLTEIFSEDYEIKNAWSGIPFVAKFPLNELIQVLADQEEFFKKLLDGFGKKDVTLGKNREKMEEQLKVEKTAKVAAIKAKAAEPTKKEATKKEAEPAKKEATTTATKKVATKKK